MQENFPHNADGMMELLDQQGFIVVRNDDGVTVDVLVSTHIKSETFAVMERTNCWIIKAYDAIHGGFVKAIVPRDVAELKRILTREWEANR